MKQAKKDPNLKIPFETVEQLKKINKKLVDMKFDNIKVLNSIAIDELDKVTKTLTKKELFDWISKNQPEVLAGPCADMFAGGQTPGECSRSVVLAANQFMKERGSDD